MLAGERGARGAGLAQALSPGRRSHGVKENFPLDGAAGLGEGGKGAILLAFGLLHCVQKGQERGWETTAHLWCGGRIFFGSNRKVWP